VSLYKTANDIRLMSCVVDKGEAVERRWCSRDDVPEKNAMIKRVCVANNSSQAIQSDSVIPAERWHEPEPIAKRTAPRCNAAALFESDHEEEPNS
jgi:hypothetical protein